MPPSIKVRLIRPSSREKDNLLSQNVADLTRRGFIVQNQDHALDAGWPFSSGSRDDRLRELRDALLDPEIQIILAARGGYGASDLLPLLPWDKLKKGPEKFVVGFSDVSALHSAFYSQLGWRGIHGLMPSNSYWGQGGFHGDVDALCTILANPYHTTGTLTIGRSFVDGKEVSGPSISGKLWGGCFSVLTNLIGTPYFPRTLADHVIFWEDIGENPGRLMRFLNQWLQSGALQGVKGIVMGRFVDCDDEGGTLAGRLPREVAQRTGLPVFESEDFGHCSPNFPLMVGAHAKVTQSQLTWTAKEMLV